MFSLSAAGTTEHEQNYKLGLYFMLYVHLSEPWQIQFVPGYTIIARHHPLSSRKLNYSLRSDIMAHYHGNSPHPLIFIDTVLVTEGDLRGKACSLWS